MIYVRKHEEEVFTPLHLCPPTLYSMRQQIADKYGVDPEHIHNVYRQSAKKG